MGILTSALRSPDAAGPWRIRLFGGLNVEFGPHSLSFYCNSHTGGVLGYLAYHSGLEDRNRLAEIIRPEVDPELALGSLRATLSELRKRLHAPENSLLVGTKAQIGLRAEAVTTDVAEFQDALTAAKQATSDTVRLDQLGRALELYRGPLLDKFEQEWIEGERAFLEGQRREALAQWVRLHIALGTPDTARSYVQRVVKQERWEQEAYGLLMEIELAIGRPAYALRHYATLKEALDQECLGDPAPALKRLADRARAAQRHAALGTLGAKRPRVRPASATTPSSLAACNLLPPLDPFFGQEREIARLCAALWPGEQHSSPRLITLTGPGGAGKTRLALEVALRLRDDYAGRAYFVSLADTDDPGRIVTLIADTLLIRHNPQEEALPQLQRHIGAAPVLLLLDNYEHLAERGASTLSQLLRVLPPLTVCLTSRRPAEIQGEQIYPLLPLPTPSEAAPAVSDLLRFPSVGLFLARARQACPALDPSAAEPAMIAAICRRLDGIPLGLELAAAWAGEFTLEQIKERLTQPLELLVSRHRDVPDRHRSLRAALDWSYDLLTPLQQRVLSSLAVFRGGWTLEAAEAVLASPCRVVEAPASAEHAPAVSRQDLWTALRELRSRSLIQSQDENGAMRYRMLETIREYALERLTEMERRAARTRHASLFLRWMGEAYPHLRGNEAARWFGLFEPERDNFAAAQEHLIATGEWRQAIDLADGLGLWKQMQGMTLIAGGHFERALALAREYGDTELINRQLIGLGHNRLTLSRYNEARRLLHESLALAERRGDVARVARSHYSLGGVELASGHVTAARSHYERSLALFRQLRHA